MGEFKKKGVGKGGKNKTSFVRLRYIQYDTVALHKKIEQYRRDKTECPSKIYTYDVESRKEGTSEHEPKLNLLRTACFFPVAES